MKRPYLLILSFMTAPTLASCSTSSLPAITVVGVLPSKGVYRLVNGEHLPAQLEEAVTERLKRLGFERENEPAYLIQIAYAKRPPGSGAFVAGQSQWLVAPERRSRKQLIAQFSLRVTDLTNGREIYHASATRRRASPADLVAAVLPGSSYP